MGLLNQLIERCEREGKRVYIGAVVDVVTLGVDQYHMDNFIREALLRGMDVTITPVSGRNCWFHRVGEKQNLVNKTEWS